MTWFINVSIIKINHLNTEEYERNTVYRKIRSHHQTDGSEPEMVMEVVEIYVIYVLNVNLGMFMT